MTDSPRWLEAAEHRRLAVHTTEDTTFEGILRLAAEDGVLLWNASIGGDEPIKLDGEVFIPRDRILFVQTLRM